MQVTLLGAAGEVTGSAYLVETAQARVLVDFGMFQGRRLAESANAVPDVLDPARLDAVVLTHAHLDHTGRLPLLARRGYRGPIFGTPATLDLTRLILADAARLQEQDAARENRQRQEQGLPAGIEPLYTTEDAKAAGALFRPIGYDGWQEVAPGVAVHAHEAGHVLGSAALEVRAVEDGRTRTVVFSGDLGPRHSPILRDADDIHARADLVFLESTYGDRDHRSLGETVREFRQLVLEAVERRGKILVPTFAVGRAQQILYHLAEMFEEGAVRRFPVFVDSPMAIEATRLYSRHAELFDEEMRQLADPKRFLRHLESVRYAVSVDESRAINSQPGPCLVMAGAGMCNAGRILHHLRHNLGKPGTVVLIVGYQSPDSLGRRLLEGARQVTVLGDRIDVQATVRGLGGFSAHAGQTDLLQWLEPLAAHRPRVVLTHGEDEKGRRPLAARIGERFGLRAELPVFGETIRIG